MSDVRATLGAMDPRVSLPLRSVAAHAHSPPQLPDWLADIPAVGDLLTGFEFESTTIFVGENGAGKSTIIEAIATALDLPHGGGSAWEVREHAEEAPVLTEHLQIIKGATTNRQSFFLRAETMHESMAHLMEIGALRGFDLSQRSHGETFVDTLTGRFLDFGLWILDEPESALSFTSSLTLLQLIRQRERAGLQTVMATHSPILASAEGARLVELGEWGIRDSTWDDLDMVAHWRRFLDEPRRYTRYFDEE